MAHKNQERSSYEQQWQQAFEQSELKPSEDLWKNIDGELTRQESGKYRRGFFFYRAVAALALLILAGLGLYVANDYLQHRQDGTVSTAADQPASESTLPAQTQTPSPEAPVASRSGRQSPGTETTDQAIAPANKAVTPPAGQIDASVQAVALANPKAKARPTVATQAGLPSDTQQASEDGATARQAVVAVSYVASRGVVSLPAPGMAWLHEFEQLYHVPNPYVKDPRKEADRTVFFAGLTLAGNYFDPNVSTQPSVNVLENAIGSGDYPYNAPLSLDSRTTTPWATTQSAGVNNTPDVSLSYEAQVGMHLSKHLSLESGIGYGRFNTQTSTNWSIENAQSDQRSPLAFSNTKEASRNLRYAPTTNFTNSFELLSLPLKMGYHIIWGSMDVFLSSGMAANFFIRNTLSDADGLYEQVDIRAGGNSPYKPVFYTGLLSGGVNYNFWGNYFVTLAPKYQFALTEMTQNDALITSQPYSFGMDVGLRYTFR